MAVSAGHCKGPDTQTKTQGTRKQHLYIHGLDMPKAKPKVQDYATIPNTGGMLRETTVPGMSRIHLRAYGRKQNQANYAKRIAKGTNGNEQCLNATPCTICT
jgi:hypothetical protein